MAEGLTPLQMAARLTPSQRALLTDHDDWTKSGDGIDELIAWGLVTYRCGEEGDDVVFYDVTPLGRRVRNLISARSATAPASENNDLGSK